ncbi:T9SS type A sorting domain-containing protein [Chryseobacterium populi]|uniref:Por secretion system C-terminal sorting domain containing protein n=1 Tax=Chryseobacterium populi TaxID=1144316 RepID=J2JWB0_9FLAO|nr:T9SS type A sorting domain-containing protein [Chryseobacterium populi]EJL72130.1 Por secretion system C-terminal sorting domain containing protein [Chryseobacterium populi]
MKNYLLKEKPFYSHFYKINKFVYIVLFISCFGFAQKKEASEIHYTPNGIFDQVFDNQGRVFKLSEIEAISPHSTKSGKKVLNIQSFSSGIFELYFENGSGMEVVGNAVHDQRRAIILQAFLDISDFINTPLKNTGNNTKVKFWIRNPSALGLSSNTGSSASAFYSFPTFSAGISNQGMDFGGILDNEIWKTIHTGVDSYSNTVFPIINTNNTGNFYHGWACFNFAGTVNWNLDYNKYNAATSYPSNYLDFYSTIIHEVTHALGFNSLMRYNGNSSFYNNPGNYFTRYDKNLKTSSGLELITNSPATGGQMYGFNYNPVISGPVLFPGCNVFPPEFNGNSGSFNCSNSIKYVGNLTVSVYTPPCFENGGSLSHFEDACYNGNSNDQYFMMSDRASGLFAKRTLTNEERQVLCDIGYSLQGTFGSTGNFTYKNYGVASCAGISIGGVNDGFLNGVYAYQGNAGANINVDGILNNDYTSSSSPSLGFEFVQDLYDPDAIISGITPTSFVFKSYVPGVHLLRYVPFDISTGQRGNITYIYVNVFNNCTSVAQPNLVRNGDFEEHNYAPSYTSQMYKSCGWQCTSYFPSPDYFNSDSTYPHVSIPSNIFGTQADKINGNHAYAGMFISPNRPALLQNVYSESLKTELTSSLQPNTKYQLSFDVSMADNHLSNGIKFQIFITDINLELTTGGIIPISNITSDKVFLTNPTFSGSASATEWETITFTFTTGSNPNLKYLHIGGLNNVQFQNSNGPDVYYYLDNVSLTPVSLLGLSTSDFENNDFEVFPNPANSIISITNSKSTIKSIELYDMAGRILKAEKVNKTDVQLDISNYQIGTYSVKIITEKGSISKKVIKY